MRQIKILLAVLVTLLVFMMGYFSGQTGEEKKMYPVALPIAEATEVVDPLQEEKEYLIQKVDALINKPSVSEAIVTACMKHTEDYKLCIRSVIWVSNAESWMFRVAMKPSNNGFGLMQRTNNGYKKRSFTSIEDSIYYWVHLYVDKQWSKRTTGQARLDWRYCTSQCTNRVGAYNVAIKKLGLD